MVVEQGKKTLLIVDDTELFIQLQISHLGRKRYNIHTAKNGNDGLEMARSLKPDLILLDLLMPDMNGDQVSRILKGDPETSSIPVILVSSGTKEHSRSVIMSSRCDGLIFKPVRRDLLLSVVENLLETNLRLYDRIEVSIPCTATFEGKEIPGTIHCLGGNGAFVEVDEKLIRGDVLGVKFTLPILSVNINATSAAVVWCGTHKDGGPEGAGLQFLTIDPEARKQIGDLVQTYIDKDDVKLKDNIAIN
jgi:twitching motility two-component system response regulator PilH